eukprot:1183938-Prorocentrum_minimum.AAC.2
MGSWGPRETPRPLQTTARVPWFGKEPTIRHAKTLDPSNRDARSRRRRCERLKSSPSLEFGRRPRLRKMAGPLSWQRR